MNAAPPAPDLLGRFAAQLTRIEQRLDGIERAQREIRQLVGPFGVPIGPDTLLVQTLHGVKYLVPTHDLVMTPQLVVYRQWEAELSVLLPTLCPPGSVFVDIGANFGYFTCLLAARMGRTPGSRVIAVEPNPQMFELLKANIRINWSTAPVRLEAVAIAAEAGLRTLHVPKDRAANAALAADGETDATCHEVRALPLDELLRDEPRVNLIKVDVEGFEPEVFRGATETLARPDLHIVFEWSQVQLRQAGFDPLEVPARLREAGFRLYDAERWRTAGEAARICDAALVERGYMNLLAVR